MPRTLPLTETLLSALGGVPAQTEPLDSSPRSRVWRVRRADGRPVIVKQITDDGDAGADADARFARELTGLRLAGRGSVAPALLAADPAARVLVLEYVDDLGRTDDWPGLRPLPTADARPWY